MTPHHVVEESVHRSRSVYNEMSGPDLRFDFKLTELVFKESTPQLAVDLNWVFLARTEVEKVQRMILCLNHHGIDFVNITKAEDRIQFAHQVVHRLSEYYV